MGDDLFAGCCVALRIRRGGHGKHPADTSMIEQVAARVLVSELTSDMSISWMIEAIGGVGRVRLSSRP
jgi:hypothetical protein